MYVRVGVKAMPQKVYSRKKFAVIVRDFYIQVCFVVVVTTVVLNEKSCMCVAASLIFYEI